MSIAIPESKCSQCGYATDMASPVANDESIPKPGDLSICLRII